jgi:hypothetical protein
LRPRTSLGDLIQQVNESVVVVIEEHGSGGMRNQTNSSILGNVFEVTVAIILEELNSLD